MLYYYHNSDARMHIMKTEHLHLSLAYNMLYVSYVYVSCSP